jgi:predicted lipoprotein with Yx(FWY)xxD motif
MNTQTVTRTGAIALTAFALFTQSMAHAGYPDPAPVAVKSKTISLEILTDPNEMTVYTFDRDQENVSNCYDVCAEHWPPVLLPQGAKLELPLGSLVRKDGAVQLSYRGKPIYTFADDHNPGDINGDGVRGVWHLVRP